MLEIKDLNDVAILVDFDGTITTEDTNDILVSKYGNEKVKEVDEKYNNGKIDLIDLFNGVFSEIKLTEKEYVDFILREFKLSEGFVEFYNYIKSYNIPFAIISGGFDNGIIPLLKKHGIENINILSNHLNFSGMDITVEFHDNDFNCCEFGPCGNCKVKHYRSFKEKYKQVIFIGDGSTDEKVANIADVVFAKDLLLRYCISKGIEYIPWKDFNDINNVVFNMD